MRRVIVPLELASLGLQENTIAMALFCESEDFGIGTLRHANWGDGEVSLQFDYDGKLTVPEFRKAIRENAADVVSRCNDVVSSGKYIDYEVDGLNLIYKGRR